MLPWNTITVLQIRYLCLKGSTSALLKGSEWGSVAGVKIGCYGIFSWIFLVCSLGVFTEANNTKHSSSHYTSLARLCPLPFPLLSAWPPRIPLLCTAPGATTLATIPSSSGRAVFNWPCRRRVLQILKSLPQFSILITVHSIVIITFLFIKFLLVSN